MSASVVKFPERWVKPNYEALEPALVEAGTDSASLFELAKIGVRAIEMYQRNAVDNPAVQQGVVNGAFLAFAALGTMLGLISPPGTTEEPSSSA